MYFVLSALLIIAGYVFLELYFRSQKVRVTWNDRFIGGIAGVLLLTVLWFFLTQRGDLGQPGSYVLVTVAMLTAIALGADAWLSITKRK